MRRRNNNNGTSTNDIDINMNDMKNYDDIDEILIEIMKMIEITIIFVMVSQ